MGVEGCWRQSYIGEEKPPRGAPIQYVLALHAQYVGWLALWSGNSCAPIAVSSIEFPGNDVHAAFSSFLVYFQMDPIARTPATIVKHVHAQQVETWKKTPIPLKGETQ
ncbi:hypothetical protein TcCL_Unassigned00986 [Trypanosoma cruzi]|nr:hypothetical protein TcCL_Unassigned00986 [Trypanosoma cruzi]